MPQSRRRKSSKGKRTSKEVYSKKRSNNRTKIIAILIIAALGIAAIIFLVSGRGKSGGETATASGLRYVDLVEGTGESPQRGQTVTVHYIGMLENGTKFDSSLDRGQPANFAIGVGEVIPGWDEGLMTMKVGGRRRLTIPPELGYGQRGRPPSIPPNSTLVFDIELLGVK